MKPMSRIPGEENGRMLSRPELSLVKIARLSSTAEKFVYR